MKAPRTRVRLINSLPRRLAASPFQIADTETLANATGDRFARPALSLLVGEFNPANQLHQALAALNVFHVWMATVLSIGLARLSGVSSRESAAWVFGYWIVLRVALILLA